MTDLAGRCGAEADSSGSFTADVYLQHEPLRVLVRPGADVSDGDWFLHSLTTLANWLFQRVAELLAPPVVVHADRGVIADHDLIVFAGGRYEKGQTGIPATFTSLPERNLLSKAAVGGTNCRVIEQIALARLGLDFDLGPEPPGTRADESPDLFVNRCFADHLFLDLGFQVHFDVCQVLPATGTKADAQPPEQRQPAAMVLCSLTDRDGRRLTFQDVGTGISCVLPVLGAMHSGFSFIQQPELHLHPALQAALADVAIEAANRLAPSDVQEEEASSEDEAPARGEVRQILETHSEYILLRCLKRLRQTAQGLHPENSPQRLTPDQISVLYFDPRPEGTTRVRRIRVTEDGDFIDRWPRGFFEERGRELFDE